MSFLVNGVIFRFHVNFEGCRPSPLLFLFSKQASVPPPKTMEPADSPPWNCHHLQKAVLIAYTLVFTKTIMLVSTLSMEGFGSF